MVRWLCILCFLVALWPGLALAQSAALIEADKKFKALYAQGRYAQAEPIARRALELAEREFGASHPIMATMLNNLAALYQGQGRYAEAEPLNRRSLAIREKALGPEHPDVAQSLNNQAGVLGVVAGLAVTVLWPAASWPVTILRIGVSMASLPALS